jgi:serine phosphatase RsbU (regulator of sigma subunit)/anti-sigma regulatory factor (Ser/Thr protein kinase)
MIGLSETYQIDTPPDLQAGREIVVCVLAWFRIQGHHPETLKPWRLAITEAMNNAIVHGCRHQPTARVSITARIDPTGSEVEIRDPGRYVPEPNADQLDDDLLAEHGRGGFLIARGTDHFSHRNDDTGHTLTLRWNLVPAVRTNVGSVANADGALDQLAVHLGDAYETVTAYAEFAGLLATTNDFPTLLAKVRERLARTVQHARFVFRQREGERLVLSGTADGFPPTIAIQEGGLEAAVATTRPCLAVSSPGEISAGDPLHSAEGPVVVVSVSCPRRRRGTLALVRDARAPAFTAGQIAFVHAVGDFLGTALATAESWGQRAEQLKLEQELQLAAQIQQSLLPQTPPRLAAWSVAGGCRPSRAMGGDYFDWIERRDGSALVLIADVMGKGMPAALVATMLRSTWRTLATGTCSPARLLTELNAHLVRDLAILEVFITAVLVELPSEGGCALYANAGHCPLLHRSRPGMPVTSHAVGGPPLGIDAAISYADTEICVAPGDILVAMTDGCYEFDRAIGAAEGLAWLEREIRGAPVHAPAHLVDTVLNKLHDRTVGELPDDCTFVAIHHSS